MEINVRKLDQKGQVTTSKYPNTQADQHAIYYYIKVVKVPEHIG